RTLDDVIADARRLDARHLADVVAHAAGDPELVVTGFVEESEHARLQRLHDSAAAAAGIRPRAYRLGADAMPRFVALRGREARIECDRRPREQLESQNVDVEPARDAADFERARDEIEIQVARAHVGEEARQTAERILQADLAADDLAAEHV